jgi:hypothetical protein
MPSQWPLYSLTSESYEHWTLEVTVAIKFRHSLCDSAIVAFVMRMEDAPISLCNLIHIPFFTLLNFTALQLVHSCSSTQKLPSLNLSESYYLLYQFCSLQ